MKRGLKIVLVLCLSLLMSAALIQCGGGHSPQSSGESINGATTATNSNSAANNSAANTTAATLLSIKVTAANNMVNPTIIYGNGTNQIQFTATGTYSDNSTQNLTSSSLLTWSSSDMAVATITSSGDATALTYGLTTISATAGNITGNTALTVVSTKSLKSITVTTANNAVNPSIVLGASEQFIAQGTNIDGSTQNLTSSVTWGSSANAVAVISNTPGSNGKATSESAGQTSITATLGSLTGSTTLTVTAPTLNPVAYTTPVVAVLPASIAVDSSGNIWVSNFGVNSLISLPTALTASGGVVPSSISAPTTYQLDSESPFGIAIDYLGDIWTADYNAGNIRIVDLNQPAYNVNTCPQVPVNSPGGLAYFGGSTGGANPRGIAIDPSQNVWVTNYGSATVAKLVTTYTGCQGDVSPATVTVAQAPGSPYTVGNNPYGIAIDSSNNVWVSNYGDNTVIELNSSGSQINKYTVGSGPQGIAVDPFGNIWVANAGSDSAPGNSVSMINPSTGVVSTYTVSSPASPLYGPHSIAIETSGNVWITNFGTTSAPGNTITELSSNGTFLNTYTVGHNPQGISIDFWGNVWVTNYYDNTLTVWKGVTIGPHFSPYTGPIWP